MRTWLLSADTKTWGSILEPCFKIQNFWALWFTGKNNRTHSQIQSYLKYYLKLHLVSLYNYVKHSWILCLYLGSAPKIFIINMKIVPDLKKKIWKGSGPTCSRGALGLYSLVLCRKVTPLSGGALSLHLLHRERLSLQCSLLKLCFVSAQGESRECLSTVKYTVSASSWGDFELAPFITSRRMLRVCCTRSMSHPKAYYF